MEKIEYRTETLNDRIIKTYGKRTIVMVDDDKITQTIECLYIRKGSNMFFVSHYINGKKHGDTKYFGYDFVNLLNSLA